jgi:hypothetical protein
MVQPFLPNGLRMITFAKKNISTKKDNPKKEGGQFAQFCTKA